MANMQQTFGLSQQFADCCCENRLGLANLGADIAREACADRAAVSDGVPFPQLMRVLDEHMSALRVVQPREYESIMDKIAYLR